MGQRANAVPFASKHLSSVMTQFPPAPAMGVQVVPGGTVGPPEKALPFVPPAMLALNTAGATWMKLTAMVTVPFMFTSGGSTTVWLMMLPLVNVVAVPGATGCGGVVTVCAAVEVIVILVPTKNPKAAFGSSNNCNSTVSPAARLAKTS